MSDLPILVLGFNRPQLLLGLMETLRQVKPKKLFVALDGPRRESPTDIELVEQSRTCLDTVDSVCDLRTLIREENLGCGRAVSEAISWFFDNVHEGIILEDDIRPHPSFYTYCSEMIDKYRGESRVLSVSGANTVPPQIQRRTDSYRMSSIPQIWGWATWRDRWSEYSFDLNGWSEGWTRRERWQAMGESLPTYFAWTRNFNHIAEGRLDTWDYQLVYLAMRNRKLTTIPRFSLVTNVGFGKNATHTRANAMSPLVLGPPPNLWSCENPTIDIDADRWMIKNVYGYSIKAQLLRSRGVLLK